MKFYPVSLALHDQPVTVIGGGSVAERKVDSLLEYGALVTVVAPVVTDRITALASEKRIVLHRRGYRPGDCNEAFIIIAATDDVETQKRVWQDASESGKLINTVDEPSRCNFIMPAVVKDGDITVSISTGGRSPALAARLRQRVAEVVSEYDDVIDILATVRPEVRRRIETPEQRRELHLRILKLIDDFQAKGKTA
jgi:siroheme synthase-like protein